MIGKPDRGPNMERWSRPSRLESLLTRVWPGGSPQEQSVLEGTPSRGVTGTSRIQEAASEPGSQERTGQRDGGIQRLPPGKEQDSLPGRWQQSQVSEQEGHPGKAWENTTCRPARRPIHTSTAARARPAGRTARGSQRTRGPGELRLTSSPYRGDHCRG